MSKMREVKLTDTRSLVFDCYPYEEGNWRGASWRIVDNREEQVRFLDEFESRFVEASYEAGWQAAIAKVKP